MKESPDRAAELVSDDRRAGTFGLTIVVPVLETPVLELSQWEDFAKLPFVREVLFVVPLHARLSREFPAGVRCLEAPLGRASQMNAGAKAARAEFLLFLHADTTVAPRALASLWEALRETPDKAIAFSLEYRSSRTGLRVLAWLARARDRVSPFPLGDQGLAMRRLEFLEMGGFDDEPLFEDWLLLKRLRRRRRIRVLPDIIRTAPARFERLGVLSNLARNTFLVLLNALGVSPRALVRHYYGSAYLETWLAADPARRAGRCKAAWRGAAASDGVLRRAPDHPNDSPIRIGK